MIVENFDEVVNQPSTDMHHNKFLLYVYHSGMRKYIYFQIISNLWQLIPVFPQAGVGKYLDRAGCIPEVMLCIRYQNVCCKDPGFQRTLVLSSIVISFFIFTL